MKKMSILANIESVLRLDNIWLELKLALYLHKKPMKTTSLR